MNNDPLDLDYDVINGEERYRSVGITKGGRFITAYPASVSNKKTFLDERSR